MGSMEKHLRDSGLVKRNVHDVVLVGGSARILFVKNLIPESLLGRDPTDSSILSRLLPLGAAIHAAIQELSHDSLFTALVLIASKPWLVEPVKEPGCKVHGIILCSLR